MTKHETHIQNCFWTQPKIFEDHRGKFSEIFRISSVEPLFSPAQSNYSFSKQGTLRGIHRTPYAKLVTCVKGTVYDVCVDLRKNSPTYQQYFGLCLSEHVLNSLYIPPYCGHGFLALEDSVLVYQQDGEYDKTKDETYCYKQYNINWPMKPSIVSNKDSTICNE